MEKNEKTKYRLAEAVKECMKTTPVEEITVKQIASCAGIARQTFYRNFRDREDLINWYFDKLLIESFREMGRGGTINDGLIRKFRFIRKENLFFSAAFRADTQNNLREYDFQKIFSFYRNLYEEKTGRSLEGDVKELLEMYCQSSVYMTVKWVLTGMKSSEEKLAEIMIQAMPEKLSRLFDDLGLLGSK